jgi:hypothetical protein
LWNVTRQVIELKIFGAFALIHMREEEPYQKTFPKPSATSRRITPKKAHGSQSSRFGGYFILPKPPKPQNNTKTETWEPK